MLSLKILVNVLFSISLPFPPLEKEMATHSSTLVALGLYRNPLVSLPGTLNLKTQNSASLWVFQIQADISASLAGPPLPLSWGRPPLCPLLPLGCHPDTSPASQPLRAG